MKKRSHSKRTIDFGRTKSAPVTPVERSPVKEVTARIMDCFKVLPFRLSWKRERSWGATVTQNMDLGTDGVGRQALQRLEDLWPKALPRKLPRGGGRADEKEGVSHQ